MNIFDLFGNHDEKEVEKKTGTPLLTKIAMLGLPILFMALKENNKDEKKAEALRDTLSRHEVDSTGSILDRLTQADEEDGDKIMGHILGDKKMEMIDKIAAETGASREEVYKALKKLSPTVLEQLAHETRGDRSVEGVRRTTERQLQKYQEDSNTFDLKDIAGKLLGGSSGGIGDTIKDLLGGFLK
ncbi:MAG: DUF937 domain-containing protein [Tissierellia bacterium]|nr:DUF937 domain-containing protein [Tissierellia bacterium]